MTQNTTTDDDDEPAVHSFASAVLGAGIHDGGTFWAAPDGSVIHVGIRPGNEDTADELAQNHGLELDRAELTRRVYVPVE